jgi:sigma-E factor negative regulatory protein RseA
MGAGKQEQDMTQDLSSLMDGELEPGEAHRAIGSCCGSEEHKGTWYLYHAIGDAMRGQTPRRIAYPQALIASIGQQPTVVAPRRARMDSPAARVALAAAASVATIAVVGWIGTQGGAGQPAATTVAAKPAAAIRPVADQVIVPSQALDVQEYLAVHRQVPAPDLYRPVTNRGTAPAR